MDRLLRERWHGGIAKSGDEQHSMAEEKAALPEAKEDAEDVNEVEQVFTYEGLFNNKDKRLASADPELLPEWYGVNSRKEELCLQYVENFVRQYEALFPERKPLFVTPKNECGVRKFVCTTLRPTQLPFKALYSVASAAEFFSHFMQYEPLADPTEPPEYLPSPSLTLENQVGDCFDLATLLCSYLVGSGYDAYCVHGYAPQNITLLNRTREECPLARQKDLVDLQAEEREELPIEDLRPPNAAKLSPDGAEGAQEDQSSDLDGAEAVLGEEKAGEADGAEESKIEGDDAPSDSAAAGSAENAQEGGDEAKDATGEADGEAGGEAADEGKAGDGKSVAATAAEAAEAEAEAEAEAAELGAAGAIAKAEDPDADPYAIEFLGVKESDYLKHMRDRMDQDLERKDSQADNDDEEEEEEPEQVDHLEGQRVHCWVLVRSGKRGVEQSFFVEPTTGRLYHLYGSPYHGIEAIWNNKNYWVNMQQPAQSADAPAATECATERPNDPMNLSYNLDMEEYWEYIFVDETVKAGKTEDEAEDNAHSLEAHMASGTDGALPEPDKDEGKLEGKEEKEMVLDLPPTWVDKLVLTREAYRRRFNTAGQRTQLFFKSKLESYAEHLHPHGLVRRLVLFKDRARTLPVEVREFFANRRDKLTLRVRSPLEGRVVEHFAEGRASGLRMIDEVSGRSRDVYFFTGARLDGLLQRFEVIGETIVERFVGRDDHLESRSIKLTLLATQNSMRAATHSRGDGSKKADLSMITKNTMTLPRAQQGGDLAILKMKQVYSRNAEVKADQDIAKRSFNLNAGNISVIYHYAKGKITRSSRLFFKDSTIPPEIRLSGTFAEPLRESQIEEELQTHLQAEKDCYQSVRDAEREMQDILALRKREEANIVLEKSIFDTARDNAKKDTAKQSEKQVEEEKDPRHVDYLTPFLQHIPNVRKIKREEAEAARDACLKSLKERLLERANIIQTRLDEENAQLAKKQAAFQRSRDHVDGADQEFERFCSEAMFRIQILEQRLARHEESALSVYANLDQKLRQDPRLAIIFGSG